MTSDFPVPGPEVVREDGDLAECIKRSLDCAETGCCPFLIAFIDILEELLPCVRASRVAKRSVVVPAAR